MNKLDNKDILTQVATEVLEQAAFVFCDASSGEISIDTWDPIGVSLDFTGPQNGRIHFWADKGFAKIAVINMMGIDDDSPTLHEKSIDAVKELLNMIVGNILTNIYGTEPVFSLGIPEILSKEILAEDSVAVERVVMEVEGFPILINMIPHD